LGSELQQGQAANLQKKQAVVELSAAQRTLLAGPALFLREAQAARAEFELLSKSVDLQPRASPWFNMRYQGGESTVLEVRGRTEYAYARSNAYNDGLVRFLLQSRIFRP